MFDVMLCYILIQSQSHTNSISPVFPRQQQDSVIDVSYQNALRCSLVLMTAVYCFERVCLLRNGSKPHLSVVYCISNCTSVAVGLQCLLEQYTRLSDRRPRGGKRRRYIFPRTFPILAEHTTEPRDKIATAERNTLTRTAGKYRQGFLSGDPRAAHHLTCFNIFPVRFVQARSGNPRTVRLWYEQEQ